MFTGIVSDIGTIVRVEQRGDLRLVIRCGYDMDDVAIGASIACSGVCLTVVDKGVDKGMDKDAGWFAVDASAETIGCTATGMWVEGARLNLERALKLGEELGGHIVTGHVDGIARVISVTPEGESHRVL
ncbi:MAG: riboflavin synthase, partial [Sphingobium sp. 32-64-5]